MTREPPPLKRQRARLWNGRLFLIGRVRRNLSGPALGGCAWTVVAAAATAVPHQQAVSEVVRRPRLATSNNRTPLPFDGSVGRRTWRSEENRTRPSESRGVIQIDEAGAMIGLEPTQIERPGSPSMTCWRSNGRSPGFQSDAVWTTR